MKAMSVGTGVTLQHWVAAKAWEAQRGRLGAIPGSHLVGKRKGRFRNWNPIKRQADLSRLLGPALLPARPDCFLAHLGVNQDNYLLPMWVVKKESYSAVQSSKRKDTKEGRRCLRGGRVPLPAWQGVVTTHCSDDDTGRRRDILTGPQMRQNLSKYKFPDIGCFHEKLISFIPSDRIK